MVRQLPVNIWPRRNLRPGEQDPARLRSRGQLAVKCSGRQTARCSCFILTYLRTSSTSPGFLINCWASLPVPASAQCLKGMAEGTSQGPQRNESSFSNSRHLSFPLWSLGKPFNYVPPSLPENYFYQSYKARQANKQNSNSQHLRFRFLYLAKYSIPLSLRSFCICHVSASSGEVGSIAAHGSTSWIEFHQALPLTPRWAPEAGT